MAKVYFGPYKAVKYVGTKAKELSTSLARPKPVLKKGDIVIVDKRQASNMTLKGFGEFELIDEITFVKKDKDIATFISEIEEKLENSIDL